MQTRKPILILAVLVVEQGVQLDNDAIGRWLDPPRLLATNTTPFSKD